MEAPKIIIELDRVVTNKERQNIIKGLQTLLNITDDEVKLYDAKEYTFSSSFSQIVYEEVRRELAENYDNYRD